MFLAMDALASQAPAQRMQAWQDQNGVLLLDNNVSVILQARAVKDYFAFANIDLAANQSHAADRFCGAAPVDLNTLGNQCLKDFALQWTPEKQKQY